MADEVITTPAEEVKTPEPEAQPEKKEQTVSEALQTEQPKKPETVGLDKFLELKKENKELRRDMKELMSKIEDGASVKEISKDLEELSKEYPDVDPKFLQKFAAAVKEEAKKEMDAEYKPLKEKDKSEKINKIFNEHFKAAMDKMPEFEKIVNPEVIKTLSLDPKNANKTFTQLIEETYGNALSGKRTIEPNTPRGGKEPEEVDYEKAQKDGVYFKEIMANPELKKKYNDGLITRLSKNL